MSKGEENCSHRHSHATDAPTADQSSAKVRFSGR